VTAAPSAGGGPYLVGIDNGSQSTKVTVFDLDGGVVCQAQRPLRPTVTPRPGIVEHPGDDLWDSIGEACRAALQAFPGPLSALAGVGLCTIRFCRALLRGDGTLAAPVMSWMDERVSRPHAPEAEPPGVAWITTSSGYLGARMTGRFRDTAANYQGVWPISTDRWEWLADDEGFAACNMARDRLYELVMPGEVLGEVTPAAAAHTGLPAGLPVVATANDKAVEALGCGLSRPGELLVSLGTYIAGMTVGEKNRTGRAFWSNFASIPGRYLYESWGVRRGMWMVSWWRDVLGVQASGPAAALGISAERFLDDEAAATVPPGSDGLMVTLDWLAPTDAPFKKGSILGFDVRHGRLHVHRAILEGIALTIHRRAGEMGRELGESFDRLVLSGGGASSPLFVQIFADVFGTPVRLPVVADAVGLGAAMCAAVGLGLRAGFDEAIATMVRSGPEILPDRRATQLYARMQPVYDSIAERTDEIFKRSSAIFG
jgi:sugar (pentulose or hexulose) kinase